MRTPLVAGLLAASIMAGCSASSPSAAAPSAAAPVASAPVTTAPAATAHAAASQTPTASPTAPPTPSPAATAPPFALSVLAADIESGAAKKQYAAVSAAKLFKRYKAMVQEDPDLEDAIGDQGGWSAEVPRASNLLLCLNKYKDERPDDIIFGCGLLMQGLVRAANDTGDPKVVVFAKLAIGYVVHNGYSAGLAETRGFWARLIEP